MNVSLHIAFCLSALLMTAGVGGFPGGKVADIKESNFMFKVNDGSRIEETISVTSTEVDIKLTDGRTRVIYDYSKGFVVMNINDGSNSTCYITSFERGQIIAPTDLSSLENTDVNTLLATAYNVDTDSEVDPAILSPRSRDICAGIPIFWMSPNKIDGSKTMVGRYRRGCKPSCRLKCSIRKLGCKLSCKIKCTFG